MGSVEAFPDRTAAVADPGRHAPRGDAVGLAEALRHAGIDRRLADALSNAILKADPARIEMSVERVLWKVEFTRFRRAMVRTHIASFVVIVGSLYLMLRFL